MFRSPVFWWAPLFCLIVVSCVGPSTRKPAPGVGGRPSQTGFLSPLPGARVLSPFGMRGRRRHDGIDLQLSRRGGDPVLASAAGRVAEAGVSRGYGRMVLIEHADGWHTRYAHLRSFRVRKGAWVKAGEKIGEVGRTGRASAPHLHFEILTPDRRAVDPAPRIFKKQ